MAKNKADRAYTLIELIIVVGILMFFSGLVITQYNAYSEQARLKAETQKLADMLELARKKAQSQELDSNCTSGSFNGYEVKLLSNGYTLNYCTAANCATYCTDTNRSLPNIYSFPTASLSIYSPSTPYAIEFVPNYKMTNLLVNQIISIKNAAISATINNCLRLTITPVGTVSVDTNWHSCP